MRKLLIAAIFVILVGCADVRFTAREIDTPAMIEEGRAIEAYFCPSSECEDVWIKQINTSKKTVHCAFFEYGSTGHCTSSPC